MTVVVQGYAETARAFGKINREFPKEVRRRLKLAAEPVRRDVTALAGASIRNLGAGDPWAQTRVGGGTKLVYVAMRQRGRRSRFSPRVRRPNLADLLMERAMKPALDRNREKVAGAVDDLMGEMANDWGRGG